MKINLKRRLRGGYHPASKKGTLSLASPGLRQLLELLGYKGLMMVCLYLSQELGCTPWESGVESLCSSMYLSLVFYWETWSI